MLLLRYTAVGGLFLKNCSDIYLYAPFLSLIIVIIILDAFGLITTSSEFEQLFLLLEQGCIYFLADTFFFCVFYFFILFNYSYINK